MKTIQLDQRPRLSHGTRLRYDAPTRSYVLLSPERGLRLNDSASEILLRCNGELTVKEIAAELLSVCKIKPSAPNGSSSTDAGSGATGSSELGAHADVGDTSTDPSAEELTKDVLSLLVELRQRQLLFFDSVL
jgi:pyrroloquinoline quinone biosynthesis protein D